MTDAGRALAAPSGTTIRFLLLALAAVSTSAIIYALGYLALPAHAHRYAATLADCRPVLDGVTDTTATFTAGLERQADAANALRACMRPPEVAELTTVGTALAVQLLLVVALYLLHPWWIRRRGRLVPIDGDPALRDELDRLVAGSGLRRAPRWLLAPYSYAQGGQAFGLPWHPAVRLDVGLRILLVTDPPRFRAVVRHELAHLRNRDVAITYLTVAVWWVYAITAALPALLLGRYHLAVPAVALLLTPLIYLARGAVLRTRERYADVAAGDAEALLAALDALPEPSRFARLAGTHPSPSERRLTVREPLRLLRTAPADVLAFGLVVGVAMTNVLLPVPLTFGSSTGAALVGLAVAAALSAYLAACARREAARGRVHWLRTPLLLALGVSVGAAVSVLSVLKGWSPAAPAIRAALLCLGVFLWYAWFASAFRAAGERAAGERAARALTVAMTLTGAAFLLLYLQLAAGAPVTTGFLGPPPTYGAGIGWYRVLAEVFAAVHPVLLTFVDLPLGLALLAFAALPLIWARPPFRLRLALATGAIAGGVALLVAAALPALAGLALPVAVRHPAEDYHLGGPATFDTVLLYAYLSTVALALVAAAAVVAFRAERLRPALVPAAMATALTVAAPGVYVLRVTARCLDIYADGRGCAVRPVPIAQHLLLLDLALAWAVLMAVPVSLVAAGIRRPSRRPAPAPAPAPVPVPAPVPAPAVARPLAVLAAISVGTVFATAELPRLAALVHPDPGDGPSAAVDRCLLGFWVEESREQLRPDSLSTVAPFRSRGSVWSFTAGGTATLFFGRDPARPVEPGRDLGVLTSGTIRWRVTTHDGFVGFTEPLVSASLTAETGGGRSAPVPLDATDAADYALPAAYTCGGGALSTWAAGYRVELRRIGR